MSEALFHRAAGDRHESRSAGTRPAEQVHPAVVEAMREVGIDLSQKRPAPLTDDLARWPDMVVTMGCGEECPVIPGKRMSTGILATRQASRWNRFVLSGWTST